MKCLGYDPRTTFRPKVLPFDTDYIGAFPPSTQLLKTTPLEQPASVSADLIDFGVIPLGSSASNLFVIKNRLASCVKFSIIEPADKGIFTMLSFSPNEGIIEPSSQVLVNIRCITDGGPKIFYDRIKISVCEVLSDDIVSISSTLFSKMKDTVNAGKVNLF
jgi:hypothetical protein